MSSVRTANERSIEVSLRHQRTQTTGATAPIASSAPSSAQRRGSAAARASEPSSRPRRHRGSRAPRRPAPELRSGAIRAIRVKAVTSTSALPIPMIAGREQRHRVEGDDADDRQRRTPQHDSDTQPPGHRATADQHRAEHAARPARRCRPRPGAHPTLDSVPSSRSIATTRTNTLKAPRKNACSTTRPTTTPRPSFAPTAASPSRTSATSRAARVAGDGDALVVQPDQQAPPTRSAQPPAKTKTAATSATATSTAATSGPTMTLTESRTPRATLTDVSSSGLRQSDGIRAEWLAR